MLNLIKDLYLKLTKNSTKNSTKAENFYINVPYSEKDEAKKLGAKWDPVKKSWFIPSGFNHTHFKKWLPKNESNNSEDNIKSVGYFIAESLRSCWKCQQSTPVFAFFLPENHQIKEYEDEENDRIIWKTANYKTIISFTCFLNKKSIETMQKFSSQYYFDSSKQSSGSYYMNHCNHCNSKLGDFYMHSEPGGAFQPMTSEAAQTIKLVWFNELFEAHVGTNSIDIDHFDHMQIISK